MPILDIQKRARELGRIRIGQVVPTQNGKTRPEKLDRFRLTSASKVLLDKVAELYGGEVREWHPQGGGAAAWEVVTDSQRIPILVPPQPITQWLEHWTGGGCKRRCDGVTEQLSDQPCICKANSDAGDSPTDLLCKPTTRLNVVLRDVEGIGVWRLESHGWNAASELPDVVAFLEQAGGYVDGFLALEQRTSKAEVTRNGETKIETRHFMVPTIEVGVTPAELLAGKGRVQTPSVEGPVARKAIESDPSSNGNGEQRLPTLDDIAKAETREQVANIWRYLNSHDALTPELEEACTQRVADIAGHKPPPEPEGEVDEEAVWQQIVARAGDLGMTTEQLHDDFAANNGGVVASAASAGELQAYLTALQERAA